MWSLAVVGCGSSCPSSYAAPGSQGQVMHAVAGLGQHALQLFSWVDALCTWGNTIDGSYQNWGKATPGCCCTTLGRPRERWTDIAWAKYLCTVRLL